MIIMTINKLLIVYNYLTVSNSKVTVSMRRLIWRGHCYSCVQCIHCVLTPATARLEHL